MSKFTKKIREKTRLRQKKYQARIIKEMGLETSVVCLAGLSWRQMRRESASQVERGESGIVIGKGELNLFLYLVSMFGESRPSFKLEDSYRLGTNVLGLKKNTVKDYVYALKRLGLVKSEGDGATFQIAGIRQLFSLLNVPTHDKIEGVKGKQLRWTYEVVESHQFQSKRDYTYSKKIGKKYVDFLPNEFEEYNGMALILNNLIKQMHSVSTKNNDGGNSIIRMISKSKLRSVCSFVHILMLKGNTLKRRHLSTNTSIQISKERIGAIFGYSKSYSGKAGRSVISNLMDADFCTVLWRHDWWDRVNDKLCTKYKFSF